MTSTINVPLIFRAVWIVIFLGLLWKHHLRRRRGNLKRMEDERISPDQIRTIAIGCAVVTPIMSILLRAMLVPKIHPSLLTPISSDALSSQFVLFLLLVCLASVLTALGFGLLWKKHEKFLARHQLHIWTGAAGTAFVCFLASLFFPNEMVFYVAIVLSVLSICLFIIAMRDNDLATLVIFIYAAGLCIYPPALAAYNKAHPKSDIAQATNFCGGQPATIHWSQQGLAPSKGTFFGRDSEGVLFQNEAGESQFVPYPSIQQLSIDGPELDDAK